MLIIIADVIFFSVIYLKMDNATASEVHDQTATMPWLLCLVVNGGNKNACLSKTEPLVVNEATVMAVLYLLSVRSIHISFVDLI